MEKAAQEAGGAATHAEKVKKYDHAYIFQPIAFETSAIGSDSMCFLLGLARRLRSCTDEPNSFTYLLQHLPVVKQVGNPTSVIGSLINKFNDCNSEDFI